MKIYKRLSVLMLCLLMAVALIPLQDCAADGAQEVGLCISYQDQGRPLSGAGFRIYLVATMGSEGELTATGDFAQFPVRIAGEDEWRTLASTLEGYVLRDGIAPADSGVTDGRGMLSFPSEGKHLSAGLYLVLGERHAQDGYQYDSTPFMVMLPGEDSEGILTVSVKFDSSILTENPDENVVSRKVLKVWEDDGAEQSQPGEATIQLLRDGEVYDTVILNAENNWRHTWTNLDDHYVWLVVEKEMPGYTVSVTREEVTFVVTNICDDPEPQEPDSPGGSGGEKLPQTGQLWWPVPILIAAGLLFVALGFIRRRSMTDED